MLSGSRRLAHLLASPVIYALVNAGQLPREAGLPRQVMGGLVFVVGVHFVALAAAFGEPFFRWLGGAITVCGLAGSRWRLPAHRTRRLAVPSGVLPGALPPASGWWGARQATGEHHNRRAPSRCPSDLGCRRDPVSRLAGAT